MDGINEMQRFCQRCVSETIDGLRQGLSRFSGPSRVALIYRIRPESSLFICDPEYLLAGHEVRLRTIYSDAEENDSSRKPERQNLHFGLIRPEPDLHFSGLISYGCRSGPVDYQMWFTEHHPDLCSTGPIRCWMEHAAWRLSHDMANDFALYTGISGTFLKEYATNAVQDHLQDRLNLILGLDNRIVLDQLLVTVLDLSGTREEGELPRGRLSFVEPQFCEDLAYLVRFQKNNRPQLENTKHVRKLLQAVEGSDNCLISDGITILGVAGNQSSPGVITADFHSRFGFLRLGADPVCSFSRGRFQGVIMQAKLVEVEEALLEYPLDFITRNSLFTCVASLVHRAQKERFGCTLVIDLNKEPLVLSGQHLERPLDLSQSHLHDLAGSLSRVDGTLHIDRRCRLFSFGCILDGPAIIGEDLGRGARYNSALRFSSMHDNVIVVVVSADRPVSVIRNGIETSSRCVWQPQSSSVFQMARLQKWLG